MVLLMVLPVLATDAVEDEVAVESPQAAKVRRTARSRRKRMGKVFLRGQKYGNGLVSGEAYLLTDRLDVGVRLACLRHH